MRTVPFLVIAFCVLAAAPLLPVRANPPLDPAAQEASPADAEIVLLVPQAPTVSPDPDGAKLLYALCVVVGSPEAVRHYRSHGAANKRFA
jgi:hypothetical protein